LSIGIFAALLAAAFLHAGWNALVRRDADRNAAATAVAAGGLVVGAVLVFVLPAMSPAAIPFVLGSSFIHLAYYALIARAYRYGELSVAYPIMRGLAPLITTLAAIVFIEPASVRVLLGVAVVAIGIVSLGADGLRNHRAGVGAAIGNAFVIAAYTLVDGLGARASEAPATYVAWILIGGGLTTVGGQLVRRGPGVVRQMIDRWPLVLASGLMGYGAYAIALWAMTLAPIGAVAAIRESSVLFATAMAAAMLHEKFGPLRWIAATLVVAGLFLVKLGAGG
jgi:drug/metabolite transporter (DMT)-like permease